MNRILLVPQAFKGTFTAKQVAMAMQAGILRVDPEAILLFFPLADGGISRGQWESLSGGAPPILPKNRINRIYLRGRWEEHLK